MFELFLCYFIFNQTTILHKINYQNTAVYIGESHQNLEQFLPKKAGLVVLLIDENVKKQTQYNFDNFPHIIVPSGESVKQLSYLEKVVEQLINLGMDRTGFLVGIGGGVVCDLSGFVASIFMRGIKFAFLPTTLLAQVDASIGGKNGLNLGPYKNMIGTFTQPEFVLIDLFFLQTLPKVEFSNGMAEVIKHACIQDVSYFDFIVENKSKILSFDLAVLELLVLKSVAIKTEIVEADEREEGVRKLLNFGHTFGHAIEKKYNIPHGAAVSLGMVLVNEFSVAQHVLLESTAKRIESLLKAFDLPTDISIALWEDLEALVFKDKKRSGANLDLILLREVGKAEVIKKSFTDIQHWFQNRI